MCVYNIYTYIKYIHICIYIHTHTYLSLYKKSEKDMYMYIFVYICICAYRKKGIYVYMLLLLSCYIMCYSFAIPLTVACQSSLSVEFSRQEHQSGLPFPSLGDLPDPGIELVSVCISCIAGSFFTH